MEAALLRRVVVENVSPEVDSGRFPVKRTVGERVQVSADVFADGHDAIAAAVLYRLQGGDTWGEVSMQHEGNDRFTASFSVDTVGGYEYTVEGWIDRFTTWRLELSKKFGAGQDVSSELLEGAEVIDGLPQADRLRDTALAIEERVTIALDAGLQATMAGRGDRKDATRYDRVLSVTVDRVRARF